MDEMLREKVFWLYFSFNRSVWLIIFLRRGIRTAGNDSLIEYLKIAEYHRRVDIVRQLCPFGEFDGSVCAAKDKTLVLA